MTIHRGMLVVVAGLALGASGCASHIGFITLTETTDRANKTVCSAKVSGTIKVKAKKVPKYDGMAWVVHNQCSKREVEIYFKTGVTSPLICPSAGIPVPPPLTVEEGGIGAMSCFVDPSAAPGTYHYGVKGGDQVVDPDLIIKR